MFKLANIESLGININDEKFSHGRFADDLILIMHHFKEANEMLNKSELAYKEIELNTRQDEVYDNSRLQTINN